MAKKIGKRLQAQVEQAIATHGNTYAAHLATGIDLATVRQVHREMTDAHHDVRNPAPPPPRNHPPAQCGTEPGYIKHIRARQQACYRCKAAHRLYRAGMREQARQAS